MQSVLHRNLSQASHPVAITVMIHRAYNVHCADDDTDSTDYAADNNATYNGWWVRLPMGGVRAKPFSSEREFGSRRRNVGSKTFIWHIFNSQQKLTLKMSIGRPLGLTDQIWLPLVRCQNKQLVPSWWPGQWLLATAIASQTCFTHTDTMLGGEISQDFVWKFWRIRPTKVSDQRE